MSLPYLLALILGGLIVVDIVLRIVGNKNKARVADETDAVAQLQRDYPEVEAQQVIRTALTRDRRTAFLIISGGTLGFVHGVGDRFVTRQLAPADIAELVREGETGLKVRFKDVTLGRQRFEFSSMADRNFVAAALAPA